MDKEIIILGKFYLKSGHVIEEKIIFDKESSREDVNTFVEETKGFIKTAFRENVNFQLTFGSTTFRGNEIVAVTIEEQQ